MVDAWTQTDRSDFAIIKYKMQKKSQTKSLEKNKLNMMLNSQTNVNAPHSVVRTTDLGGHDAISSKMHSTFKASSSSNVKTVPLMNSGMRNYNQIPLKMGFNKNTRRHGPDTSKSQVTPGFSRNPMKAPAKHSLLHSGKKKTKTNKMRLPSIQGSRDKKTRD
jgi:hypothetical protein